MSSQRMKNMIYFIVSVSLLSKEFLHNQAELHVINKAEGH